MNLYEILTRNSDAKRLLHCHFIWADKMDTQVTRGLVLTTGVVGVIALLLVQYAYTTFRWHKKYKLPPHVPGVPIFGNTFQIPAIQQGPWGKKLAEKYGEMYDYISAQQITLLTN